LIYLQVKVFLSPFLQCWIKDKRLVAKEVASDSRLYQFPVSPQSCQGHMVNSEYVSLFSITIMKYLLLSNLERRGLFSSQF
jgi:hypothetical protein